MQLLNSSSQLTLSPMSRNINAQIRSTSEPFLSIRIKQTGSSWAPLSQKDPKCHDNSSQRLQTVALNEGYTAGLLAQLLSCGRSFAAAVHKCGRLLVRSDVHCGWEGGVGAMLFTQSISLITTGVSWHLCQGGRTPNVAGLVGVGVDGPSTEG